MTDEATLVELEETPLSGSDIRMLTGPGRRILAYGDLARYKTLQDLCGEYGAAILYRTSPAFGHWVSCFMGPDRGVFSYFDSYGSPIDDVLKDQSDELNAQLGQRTPYLTNLVDRAVASGTVRLVDVNRTDLQSTKEKVADCGRYAALRLVWCDLTNEEFCHFLRKKGAGGGKGIGTVADKNVTLLTSEHN